MGITEPTSDRSLHPSTVKSAAISKPAIRVQSLECARLAVLNNTKWNAGKLLAAVTQLLAGHAHFSKVDFFKKETYTRNADLGLLKEIASAHDIALIAIGD